MPIQVESKSMCKGIMVYPQHICLEYDYLMGIFVGAFEGGSNY